MTQSLKQTYAGESAVESAHQPMPSCVVRLPLRERMERSFATLLPKEESACDAATD